MEENNNTIEEGLDAFAKEVEQELKGTSLESEVIEATEVTEKPLSKRKQRKLKRKKKKLLYKVRHQKEKPCMPLYILELFFAGVLVFFKKLLIFLAVNLVLVSIAFLILYRAYIPTFNEYRQQAEELVDASTYDTFKINSSSKIYDAEGNLLANIYSVKESKYLSYDEIPRNIVNAYVAIEDQSFWNNIGVDFKGIARVMYRMVKTKGEEVHGASTITQQLARNIFLTHEVSIERKLKEMLIAYNLTNKYTKKEIMEFYVNDICYGNGVYGIEGAAKAYFNKGVSELTLSEQAYLCALPNRPEYYNPYKDSTLAIPRRDKILKDMYTQNYITKSQLDEALAQQIVITQTTQQNFHPSVTYAMDCATRYLMSLDGFNFQYEFNTKEDYENYHKQYEETYENYRRKLYTDGYTIQTSIYPSVQAQLQGVLDNQLAFDQELSADGIYSLQGALTVIDNTSRKVVALVGGRNQDGISGLGYNRAFQAYRQPGSSFKPLAVYTPILETGLTANSIVTNIDVDRAKKATSKEIQSMGGSQMTLRNAVEQSKNGVAWQLFDRLTPRKALSYITNMKFSNICPDDYYDSSSLGGLTYGVTTVEMAGGFSTLVNHGAFIEPTCIISIKDNKGNEIYKEPESTQVYKEKAADDMVDILKGVITKGTASKMKWSKSSQTEAMGKTGTTNNSKDGWFCGATPYYSMAVWVGYDAPKPLKNLYGGTYPSQIWKDCMLELTKDLEPKTFVRADVPEASGSAVSGGYYSYLEGRDDSEVLSDGYTVADYRNDRVIGESVYAIIDKINALDASKPEFNEELEKLYEEGKSIIDTIYSRKFTSEMTGKLNSAYSIKKGQ